MYVDRFSCFVIYHDFWSMNSFNSSRSRLIRDTTARSDFLSLQQVCAAETGQLVQECRNLVRPNTRAELVARSSAFGFRCHCSLDTRPGILLISDSSYSDATFQASSSFWRLFCPWEVENSARAQPPVTRFCFINLKINCSWISIQLISFKAPW